jgi:hypothetical protein
VYLFLVSATEAADTEPSVAKETTALATDPLKPTQSLAKAGITPECFLLAKCTGAAVAGTYAMCNGGGTTECSVEQRDRHFYGRQHEMMLES